MARKLNNYGVPFWNDQERAALNSILISKPCKVCRTKKGYRCVVGEWDGKKSTYNNRKERLKPGSVHMGRLPEGFDSVKAVKEALKKDNKCV